MEVIHLPPEMRSPRPACTSAEHAVFVMTANEKKLFFAEEPDLSGMGLRETWVDTTGLSAEAWEELLRELEPTVLVTAWSCPTLPLRWGLEDRCPLRYVCSVTGSVKPRVPREMIRRGLLVTNWGSLISYTVAEHAVLMVLALMRSLPGWTELMRQPQSMFEMMESLRSRTLRGKRVGIHGFGAVAREVVAMLRPFQVQVSAYSEGVPDHLFEEHEVHRCSSLRELFSGSDVLVECEGLNEYSRNSVTEEILRLLPEDAVFVNVGRGCIADEDALDRLAREGRLRVGLDVYRREPLATDSPLHDNPAVLLSPHVAGPTWDTYALCGSQALKALSSYLRGEALGNVVDLAIYDRTT